MASKSDLLNAVRRASRDAKLLDAFLCDLLTPDEYKELIRRWHIVRELHQGIPQRRIASRLGMGIATITRGSRMLKNKQGGFHKILQTYEMH